MSDPTDDELREWWKGTHWSDPKPSDFGSLRLAFLAGRASVTQPSREEIEEVSFAHRPVLSFRDGHIAGCACMDRVFVNGFEDWDRHIADSVLALLGVVPSTGNKEK